MKTILITGSNRGLGLEFVNQISQHNNQIIATCRTPDDAKELQQLAQQRKNITIYPLDVTKDEQIIALAEQLELLSLDWIINNAGTGGQSGDIIGNIARDNFLKVMDINCLGALKVSEIFLPLLLKSNDKLIVTISSSLGSISDNQWGKHYAYRASKAALNCVMRSFALDTEDRGVKVMLLNPGWVKTEIGGANAEQTTQQSVHALLQLIEKYKDQSHADALLNHTGKRINW